MTGGTDRRRVAAVAVLVAALEQSHGKAEARRRAALVPGVSEAEVTAAGALLETGPTPCGRCGAEAEAPDGSCCWHDQ